MVVSSIEVKHFRAMNNLSLEVGSCLTAIAGRNATMKSTLLGMLGQPFSISKGSPMYGEKTIEGYNFKSQFQEKFCLSQYDVAGEHEWTLKFRNASFYNGKDFLSIKSANRKSKGHADTIRFINSEGKQRGMGYVQLPVIYLSLSRLFPVGESGKTHSIGEELTEDEKELYINWYKRILSVTTLNNPSVSVEIKDTKHIFAGISDDVHDVATNSAGEGNIGRLLIAILSLKRLKEKYPKEYKAGILLIDELDATLFGFAQKSIVNFLSDISKENNIQIIFTTHSPIILSEISRLQRKEQIEFKGDITSIPYKYKNEIVFLNDRYTDGGKRFITGENIHFTRDLQKVLSIMNLQPYRFKQSISMYCEDLRAAYFVKEMFRYKGIDIEQYVKFVDVDLGWGNYYQLHRKGLPEFLDNIIVLDNDVTRMKKESEKVAYFNSTDNVIFTPEDVEQGMFAFLRNNSNYNEFERRIEKQGYYLDYATCFSDWPQEHYDTTEVKRWFNYLDENIPSLQVLFELWCERNDIIVDAFVNEFRKTYNKIADKTDMDIMF